MKLAPLLLLPFLTAGSANAGWWVGNEYIPSYRETQRTTRASYQDYKSDYQPGWSSSEKCYRKVYREEYVPGTSNSPGYVRNWKERVEIPCDRPSYRPLPPREPRERIPSPDGNECSEGAILGGILGGGAGAALSQGDGRWWAIPLGVVTGSVIGCDIDGG